jgi:hypothetical protein
MTYWGDIKQKWLRSTTQSITQRQKLPDGLLRYTVLVCLRHWLCHFTICTATQKRVTCLQGQFRQKQCTWLSLDSWVSNWQIPSLGDAASKTYSEAGGEGRIVLLSRLDNGPQKVYVLLCLVWYSVAGAYFENLFDWILTIVITHISLSKHTGHVWSLQVCLALISKSHICTSNGYFAKVMLQRMFRLILRVPICKLWFLVNQTHLMLSVLVMTFFKKWGNFIIRDALSALRYWTFDKFLPWHCHWRKDWAAIHCCGCVCVNVYSGEDVQRYRNIILVDYRISDPVD